MECNILESWCAAAWVHAWTLNQNAGAYLVYNPLLVGARALRFSTEYVNQ